MSKITPEAQKRCAAGSLKEQLEKWRESLNDAEKLKLSQARQSHDLDDVDTSLKWDGAGRQE